MADIGLDKRFFTNTYVTGSGRQNYLRVDALEDPLFTSFTLDIDYVTSPLFYTINYDNYGYPDVEGMGEKIEGALKYMYENNMYIDEGYDILPLLSASILDDNKLGFGLQQNVYMDMPLYGATEYIYMVDKRNGSSNQNDSRYDSNTFVNSGGNPNALNGYKLGDSMKEIVNDSDKAWVKRQKEQYDKTVKNCDAILNDEKVKNEHEENKREFESLESEVNAITKIVDEVEYGEDGSVKNIQVEYDEDGLVQKIQEYKKITETFDKLKNDIVSWANSNLSNYKNRGSGIYNGNNCIKKIFTFDNISDSNKDSYTETLKGMFGSDFTNYITSYINNFNNLFKEINGSDESFLSKDGNDIIINKSKLIGRFGNNLESFGLYDSKSQSLKCNIYIYTLDTPPDWAIKLQSHASYFSKDDCKDADKNIKNLMSYKCDINTSFNNFISDKVKENEKIVSKYERALDDIRTTLYGFENGSVCDKNNPTPDSLYGRYLEAKEKLKNDDYSQAEKAKSIANSGCSEMSGMLTTDEIVQKQNQEIYDQSIKSGVQSPVVNNKKSIVASQTVLDMLGFISGMKKLTNKYPYIIQGVTGLDTAYNKHYIVKDPYLGSGDDKITLTCLESLDLRVSSMFNRYFNAVYDRQYRRERVPVNLRRFNCSIYVHDVRNFVSRTRQGVTYNKLLELTDMYYSVIEFRFFDCEIVPEETGNIFNDISNESPSDMKKTNFTFTYGNCVVNFVPQSEVSAHNILNENK